MSNILSELFVRELPWSLERLRTAIHYIRTRLNLIPKFGHSKTAYRDLYTGSYNTFKGHLKRKKRSFNYVRRIIGGRNVLSSHSYPGHTTPKWWDQEVSTIIVVSCITRVRTRIFRAGFRILRRLVGNIAALNTRPGILFTNETRV